MWRSTLSAKELGLWRATDGKLTALANVGPANPREFQEVTSTTDVLQAIAKATGGSVRRLADGNSAQRAARGAGAHLHDLQGRRLDRPEDARRQSVVRGIGVLPIFAGLHRPVAAGRLAGRDLGARRAISRKLSSVRSRASGNPVLIGTSASAFLGPRLRGDERLRY